MPILTKDAAVGLRAKFVTRDTVFDWRDREGRIGTIMADGMLNEAADARNWGGDAEGRGGTCHWRVDNRVGYYVTGLDDLEAV